MVYSQILKGLLRKIILWLPDNHSFVIYNVNFDQQDILCFDNFEVPYKPDLKCFCQFVLTNLCIECYVTNQALLFHVYVTKMYHVIGMHF